MQVKIIDHEIGVITGICGTVVDVWEMESPPGGFGLNIRQDIFGLRITRHNIHSKEVIGMVEDYAHSATSCIQEWLNNHV